MTGLLSLWFPILLSSVFVFLASWVIHTLLPWHHGDYRQLPEESRAMDAIRALGIPVGDYMVPRPSGMQEMNSPEFTEKLRKGPVLVLTVMPNCRMSMGKTLGSWFLYTAVVGLFAAYVAGAALPLGAAYLHVFRFVGATAFIGYSVALWQMSIWYHRAWGTTIRTTIDGLIYALLTAGTFGRLWPRGC